MQLIKTTVNNWIIVISVVLGILVFSLGEIALNDISKLYPVRSSDDIFKELHTPEEHKALEELSLKIKEMDLFMYDAEYQLQGYEEDISSKKEILDQLLENQDINPNSDTEILLNKYEDQFVKLQGEKEKLKANLWDKRLDLTKLNREKDNYNEILRIKYEEKYNQILNEEKRNSELKVILTQIILLVIFLIIGILLFFKFRKTRYLSPVLGYNFAVIIILIQSIYIHSPFKLHYYTFIAIGIVLSLILIVWLIKNLNKLSRKEILSISKKNLIKGKCPICSSNISLKPFVKEIYKGQKIKSFLLVIIIIAAIFGNGSGIIIIFDNIRNMEILELSASIFLLVIPWLLVYLFLQFIFPYSAKNVPEPNQFNNNNCPVCGLTFISRCNKCGEYRHNLLPFCNNCGDRIEKEEQDS